MNQPSTSATRFLPWLLILFVGSGCAGLVYEIIWFQLLQLIIGSSAVSLGVLLATFMGGMCLGSLLLPRVIPSGWNPLRVYGGLELGIGVIGIALLSLMPDAARIYSQRVEHGASSIALRAGVCALFLIAPTILMGATLPAIARWMESSRRGIAHLGFFYGANIAGAVFGCLLAGFYLLRVHDLATATAVAAAINFVVAAISIVLSFIPTQHHATSAASAAEELDERTASGSWVVYLAIGISGFTALAAEVIWTRILSLMLGATVYTFSIILAVFLMGLGIGSSVGAYASRGRSPRLALGVVQALLILAIAWASYALTQSLPFWPIDPSLARSPWHQFQLDMMRCIWAILPAACLWGASFPLALAGVAARNQDPGKLVGGVYAANTVGAILGAAASSMLAISWLGTQTSQQIILVLIAASAVLVLGPSVFSRSDEMPVWQRSMAYWGAIGATLSAIVLGQQVEKVPEDLIGYGRFLPTVVDSSEYLYSGEGMNASVAVSELPNGVRNFHVSGKVVASSEPQDMRLQLMLGHLPALLHESPKSVLIVGCGAGVTAGTFVSHPSVERIVICEIEPLIPPAAGEHFGFANDHVMDDPRVEIVFDDARHYILTTSEKFDIITSDPIHPWVKGAAALYSEEYFNICKSKLKPGGICTQWVPLYETNLAAVKSEIATFFRSFPHGTIWGNEVDGQGYDVVLLGQAEPMAINVDRIQTRMDGDAFLKVAQRLADVDLGSAIQLLSTYAGRQHELSEWLEDAEINSDSNMRLQYLAGMGLNDYQAPRIYNEILQNRRFPDGLFVSNGVRQKALKALIERGFIGNE